MLVSSSEPSVAQQFFKRLLTKYGPPGLNSEDKQKLNADQIEHLLSRVSLEERTDVLDTHMNCRLESAWSPGITFTTGVLLVRLAHRTVGLTLAHPAKIRVGMPGLPPYVALGVFAYWGASEVGMYMKCQERVVPKVAKLWQKYGGADSTTNFVALRNQNRGGSSLVPDRTSMGVATVVDEIKSELSTEQIEYLKTRMSLDEAKEMYRIMLHRIVHVISTFHAPAVAEGIALVMVAALVYRTAIRHGLVPRAKFVEFMVCLPVITIMVASIVTLITTHFFIKNGGALEYNMNKERSDMLFNQLWEKYGREWATDNEAPSKGNRGGTPSVVPQERLDTSGDQTKNSSKSSLRPASRSLFTMDTSAYMGPPGSGSDYARGEYAWGSSSAGSSGGGGGGFKLMDVIVNCIEQQVDKLRPSHSAPFKDTEKRANVDDTNAQRVSYPDDTFNRHSDSLISGTPSGAPRERLEKSENQTKHSDEGSS